MCSIQLQLFYCNRILLVYAVSEVLHFRASNTQKNLIIDLQLLKRNACDPLGGKIAIDHRN